MESELVPASPLEGNSVYAESRYCAQQLGSLLLVRELWVLSSAAPDFHVRPSLR